jgi:hypothetical protein
MCFRCPCRSSAYRGGLEAGNIFPESLGIISLPAHRLKCGDGWQEEERPHDIGLHQGRGPGGAKARGVLYLCLCHRTEPASEAQSLPFQKQVVGLRSFKEGKCSFNDSRLPPSVPADFERGEIVATRLVHLKAGVPRTTICQHNSKADVRSGAEAKRPPTEVASSDAWSSC